MLLLVCLSITARADKRVATWYDATDLDASLQELRQHAVSFASVSVFALGNASTTTAQRASWMYEVTHTLGIEAYKLGCGSLPFDDLHSFYTRDARDRSATSASAEA